MRNLPPSPVSATRKRRATPGFRSPPGRTPRRGGLGGITPDDLRSRLRGLYAVTPDEPDTARLLAQVEAAVRGGARSVQYRNKAASPALRAAQARALASACRAGGALFIVNDDAELARAVGADGVHVGEDDGDLAHVRAVVGDAIVGVSCYGDLERAKRAVAGGADYVAFGSFFLSSVKPHARRASVDLVAAARPLGVPIVGIGGITVDNAAQLVATGIDAVAVISAVFMGDPPAVEAAAARFAALFG